MIVALFNQAARRVYRAFETGFTVPPSVDGGNASVKCVGGTCIFGRTYLLPALFAASRPDVCAKIVVHVKAKSIWFNAKLEPSFVVVVGGSLVSDPVREGVICFTAERIFSKNETITPWPIPSPALVSECS